MTAHLGNWEMIIPIMNKYKRTTVIVKVQRNSGGDRFVNEVRNLKNITLLPMGCPKKLMVDALNKGEGLGLASDQNTPNGIEVNFFGKKASIPKGAAYFYYKTKCPIVIGFCILNADKTYTFKLREIKIDKNYERIDDLFIEVHNTFSDILEQEIKKYPAQYFWFHRKFNRNIYK